MKQFNIPKKLERAIDMRFSEMQAFGEKRHEAKRDGTADEKIFSTKTNELYKHNFKKFAEYCYSTHNAKTLKACEKLAPVYATYLIEKGLKGDTISSYCSAITKFYHKDKKTFIGKTPSIKREDYTQSRVEPMRDKNFSFTKNKGMIEFIQVTGLRKHEFLAFKGKDYIGEKTVLVNGMEKTYHFVLVRSGKGGKTREVALIGDKDKVERTVELIKSIGKNEKIYSRFSGIDNIGLHRYRREYAQNAVASLRRDRSVCEQIRFWNSSRWRDGVKGVWEKNSVYLFRGEQKGRWEDKGAMLEVSRWLGHNRINVMATHYI